eukprot:COSAG05_NODE_21386_length_272_cov_0.601156_1_plen_90_part_11
MCDSLCFEREGRAVAAARSVAAWYALPTLEATDRTAQNCAHLSLHAGRDGGSVEDDLDVMGAFEACDSDHSGSISATELRSILRAIGANL